LRVYVVTGQDIKADCLKEDPAAILKDANAHFQVVHETVKEGTPVLDDDSVVPC
jgi:hypothetical protein